MARKDATGNQVGGRYLALNTLSICLTERALGIYTRNKATSKRQEEMIQSKQG